MTKSALVLLSVILVLAVTSVGCSQPAQLGAIQVTPDAPALIAGQTVQFKAIGAYAQNGHPFTFRDITTQVNWISSEVNVATISAGGLATGVSTGNTQIAASMEGVLGTASLTVSGQGVHDLTSITVIPSLQIVTSVGEPSQFIAIGTFTTSPFTLDVTDTVAWQSSDVKVATVNSAGLALANAAGETTITAIGKSNSGSSIPGTATLNVQNSGGGVVLPQLTVALVGLGSGAVTSADGVINCTTIGGAACTGNFIVGTTVTLTAVPAPGSTFGGWSVNCVPDNLPTCSIVMNNNEPVGAIFNN
jgi:Bacterial Ig-like domain (group 2)/Divergent InlB B-repeat domain